MAASQCHHAGWLSRCNHLQNVVATTYKTVLQLPTKRSCKKHLQHIVMEKYFENINGSFQEENLLRTLAASDLFSEIRGEFGG